MSKYDEMSDIGIAMAVQERLEGTELLNGGKIGKRFIEMNAVMKEFDPCNRADHAWPIVLKHRIMLNPYCADNLWKAEVPCGSEDSVTTYATCYHKNPLRAAMVVYLMMLEATNV